MIPPVALDEHLPYALADALEREGVDVVHISSWQDGFLRTTSDDVILAAMAAAGRVLITRDVNTLPDLAHEWTTEGRLHSGLVMLPKSISHHDIGGALDAIMHTLRNATSDSLANTVTYARRQR